MIENFGDMFEEYLDPNILYVITTNGSIKNNGEAVMGRGTAKAAQTLHRDLPGLLGDLLAAYGNRPYLLPYGFVTLPVKHLWMESADTDLIEESLVGLLRVLTTIPRRTLYLPRPGCGNGGLQWGQVKPLVEFFIKEVDYVTNHSVEVWAYE